MHLHIFHRACPLAAKKSTRCKKDLPMNKGQQKKKKKKKKQPYHIMMELDLRSLTMNNILTINYF